MAGSDAKADQNGTVLHAGMVPAQKALSLVLEDAAPRDAEMVALSDAANRVLAETLVAKRTQPPFAASAMDGYAVRHADLQEDITRLKIIGEAAAGHPFRGEIGSGECVRIFTGAPVPDGGDTIIIQENVVADDDIATIQTPATQGKFVRPMGLDFKTGEALLTSGSVLDPQALSLAASMGHAHVSVWLKPKVAIAATGDELVMPGESLADGQIIASNTFGISAVASAAGAQVDNLGIVKDTRDALRDAFNQALSQDADLIVTSGGASVGDHDLVKPIAVEFGFTFAFIKIAMRPGKPVLFARAVIDGKPRRLLGLAGNPVSSLVSSHVFMRPLIRMLGGYSADTVKPLPAILDKPLAQNDEREDYLRATATRMADGTIRVAAFGRQDSSMLATLARADCLIIRPVHAPAAKAGDAVEILPLREIGT